MNREVVAFLESWPFAPWTVTVCAMTIVVYLRGWRALRRRGDVRFGARHLAAFVAGQIVVVLAVASPLEPFSDLLLSVHMAQHLLLVFIAPPLLLLAAPQLPLMQGTPPEVLEYWVLPVVHSRGVRMLVSLGTHPATAWLAAALAIWLWHVPALYEMALRSPFWHRVEHFCFLGTALLFWWPVVQPYPSRPIWSRPMVLAYLFLAAMQAGVLCAFLTFADRVLYPHYEAVPRIGGISALADQEIAGAMMWVAGIVAYLVPVVHIGYGLLYARPHRQPWPDGTATQSRAIMRRAPFDLLKVWLLGPILRWPYTRRLLQLVSLIVAAAIVLDGFTGPQVEGLNLAGVLPWIHWRGVVVLALLAAGNFWCMACPFTLPRAIARRMMLPRWEWPAALRSKWLAIGLLIAFFWAYEALDVWASPWWTAWIIVGYFLAAFATDVSFRGAAFCKYVCPIGQFQFVQSLVSPLAVQVRNPQACEECHTKDCIRGNSHARGCEMQLFVPRKTDNFDCTFCLDCVNACPVSNIGVLAAMPAASLSRGALHARSNGPMLRPDIAALMWLLIFAAFANAAGMIAPVVSAEAKIAETLGLSGVAVDTVYLLLALIVIPAAVLMAVGGWAARLRGGSGSRFDEIACFASAFVPLGAAMWIAHYGFHFATGAATCVSAASRFLSDWGWPLGPVAKLARSCCAIEPPPWLLRAEILCLDLGLLATLYLAYRVAAAREPQSRRAALAFLPWGLLGVALFLIGIWILLQPMEMRGAPVLTAAWTGGMKA